MECGSEWVSESASRSGRRDDEFEALAGEADCGTMIPVCKAAGMAE
jgi:hypothetical protein